MIDLLTRFWRWLTEDDDDDDPPDDGIRIEDDRRNQFSLTLRDYIPA